MLLVFASRDALSLTVALRVIAGGSLAAPLRQQAAAYFCARAGNEAGSKPEGPRRQTMFSHVMVGTNDIERAKRFYDAVLAVVGAGEPVRNTSRTGHNRLFYRHDGSTFCVTEPIDGEKATCANGGTIAFKCTSPEQVRLFHDTAVAHGGTSIEDPPGPRDGGSLGPLHLAYVRDPDGHKLCAIYRVK